MAGAGPLRAQGRPMPFAGHQPDRADHLRADPEAMAALRARPDARLLVMDGLVPVLDGQGALQWRACAGHGEGGEGGELVFLGLSGGAPLFAPVPAQGDLRTADEQRASWLALARMGGGELAIYGGARSLVDWHARHRFCANCGSPTSIAKAGWQRICPACEAQHFPRVDPVVIMLVEHRGADGPALLLGRSHRYPPRSYSALAGFVEPGESIEDAVAREVFEEVGVVVSDVSYLASQPWPFPSQLMIGCTSRAASRGLRIDHGEIEDARWFTREQVADALMRGVDSPGFAPPPATAIAYHLLEQWLRQSAGE